jgi:hypothetical protein
MVCRNREPSACRGSSSTLPPTDTISYITPSFFRNESRTVRFGLVVDDFAVLWTHKPDFEHLLHTLTSLYQIKVNRRGNKYLGMTIAIDRKARHVTLTMLGYIEKLLRRRVKPEGTKGASIPAIYAPPNYASAVAQRATLDTSPPVPEADKRYLQSVIGILLYYSRAVDPAICTAIHELGSIQAAPTANDMAKLDRLLQYVSTHRNNGIRYYASNMIYNLMSDASYLCRPRARSVYGHFSYLGDEKCINVPVSCASKMISCVVASVAEAETAGGFQSRSARSPASQHTHGLRLPPTPDTTTNGQHGCSGHRRWQGQRQAVKFNGHAFLLARRQSPTVAVQNLPYPWHVEHRGLLYQTTSKTILPIPVGQHG